MLSTKSLPLRRSRILLLAGLLALVLLVGVSVKPVLALYHQQQGGRWLAQVMPVGDNQYGGFACLRPFLEDLGQREKAQRALEHLEKAQTLAPRQAHTYYQIGRAACLVGNYERAVAAFQTFSELRPQNPAGLLEMGFALVQACPPNGKCADGLNPYDAWRKAGVRAEDFLAMAEKARAKGDYANALLWYQNAQRMGMDLRSTIAFVRYLRLSQAEENEKVIQALESAVNLDGGWLDSSMRFLAWYQYSRALYEMDREKKAARALQTAIAIFPSVPFSGGSSTEVYRLLGIQSSGREEIDQNKRLAQQFLEAGEAARRANRYPEALVWYQQAAKLAPLREDVWYNMGLVYEKMEDWQKAQERYRLAFSLRPNRQFAARLEFVYLQLGLKQKALSPWQELAALLPESDADHWWALGRMAELTETWEEAAFAYVKGSERAQQPYDFWMRQGVAYERLQEWEQAEAVYRQALAAKPDQPWPYLRIGHTLRARQDYEGALGYYQQAMELAPEQVDPSYHIGYTYYLLKDFPKAEAYFRQALAINPKHTWSAYWLAKSLYQMQKQGEAITWLRSAIEWHGKQPWSWTVELGDWLAAAGDTAGALEAYRQALEWKPGDENIQKKIEEMLGTD